MNHATHTFGDASSVTQRFGTESTRLQCEKLLDVLCINTSGGLLYMQIFDLFKNLIPAATHYSGSA
jgi:hypothetical protein